MTDGGLDEADPSTLRVPPIAMRLNDHGAAHADHGRDNEAVAAYHEAIGHASKWYLPWLNLGAAYKRLHRWDESLRCSLRALELQPLARVDWNIGIAATAIRDWTRARWAWRKLRFEIDDRDGPVELSLGTTFVRANPDAAPQVVSCTRIDPARARIHMIPHPLTQRRYGDILLHDALPQGDQRDVTGHRRDIYSELQLLVESDFGTWRVYLEAPFEEDLQALRDGFPSRDGVVEDWTSRYLCNSCREGTPHVHERAQRCGQWQPGRELAFATRDEASVQACLASWAANGEGRIFEAPQREL